MESRGSLGMIAEFSTFVAKPALKQSESGRETRKSGEGARSTCSRSASAGAERSQYKIVKLKSLKKSLLKMIIRWDGNIHRVQNDVRSIMRLTN